MITFITKHYLKVIIVTLFLVAGCIALIPSLEIETDIVKQMPEDNEVFHTFKKVISELGTLDILLVVLELPDEPDIDIYTQFTEELADRLSDVDMISSVDYRLPDPLGYYQMLLPHLMGMATDEEWIQVLRRLSESEMDIQASMVQKRLQMPLSSGIKNWIRIDPFNLVSIFQERLNQNSQGFTLDFTSGYYISGDHKFIILLAHPTGPAQNIPFSRSLLERVKQAEAETLNDFRQNMDDPTFRVNIRHGGGYVVAIEDGSIVKTDMIRNMSTSFIGVLILFLFAFRRWGSLIFASIPIVVGMLFTFAFTTIALGEVNAASSAFAALLIGLAIDFIIVTYARYIEERRAGADCQTACRALLHSCYKPVFIGAITTAATFFSFYTTTLPGLQELGILTGIGVLICMLTIFILLPTMFTVDAGKKRSSRLYLHSFGSDYIVMFALKHAWSIVAVSVIMTVLSIILAVNIPFVDDANTMRSPDNKGVLLRNQLSESFGTNFSPMMVIVKADSEVDLIDKNQQLGEFLDILQEQKVIANHSGLYQFLPSVRWQQDNIESRKNELALFQSGAFRDRFSDSFKKQGLNPEAFTPFLEGISRAMLHPEPITPGKLPADDPLVRKFLNQTNGSWESIASVYPPSGKWRRTPPPRLETWIKARGDHYTLTGVNVLSREIRTIARIDAFRATTIGFILVFFLLYMDFKKLSHTFFSLVPLFFGITWMLGSMRIMGIHLNSMNIFVIAMIIGIGVDYGIHVVHRYLEGGEDPWFNVSRTGNAIIVAALSTMIGFGTLTMSRFPGLKSMGLLAILGAAYCAIASLTIFPVLIKLFRIRPGKHP